MTDIEVPDGLTEDEIVEYIRWEIATRGGDPDTARVTSITDSSMKPIENTFVFHSPLG